MSTLFLACRVYAAILALFLVTTLVAANDWPQWRGPNRDGAVSGVVLPDPWPETLKEEWQVTVGEGYSSPVVDESRIYLLTRQKEDEIAWCLDRVTGKEIWRSSYSAPYEMHPAARAHGKGPKSTPVVAGGRLYTFGIRGILTCWDAKTGDVKWRKEFAKRYPRTSPLYGTVMSPLVDNGLLIAHVGGHDKGAVTAFRAETGEIEWEQESAGGPGYASPIIVNQPFERQIVTQSQTGLLGISTRSGKLIWIVPFTTEYDQNSVTPVVYKDTVIYGGYNQPITAARYDPKKGAMKEVWATRAHTQYLSSPVLKGNLLFGMSTKKRGQIFCLDADTGKTLWQNDGGMGDNVALVSAGSAIVLLTNSGQLVFFKPTATGYDPIKQYKVAEGSTWAHPVLLDGRILIKDGATLKSWSWRN